MRWQERTVKEASAVLDRYLSRNGEKDESERHCLEDWWLAKGIEFAIEYDLPFKLHTGYCAHHSHMKIDHVKHFPNVYIDLCWAWSIDPHDTSDFLRHCIHAVPSNKLFAFGGDTLWPTSAVAYAHQARNWLTRALQAELDTGLLKEREAIDLASRYMKENQYACFNIDAKRKQMVRAH